MRDLSGLLVVLFIVAGPAAAVTADPSYQASISGTAPITQPDPFTLTANFDSNGGHVEGFSTTDSLLTARIEANDPVRGFNTGFSTTGETFGQVTVTDVVITGPGTAPVPMTLHLPFHVTFFQDWSFLDTDTGPLDVSRVNQSATFTGAIFTLFGGSPAETFVATLDDHDDTATDGMNSVNGGAVQATGNPAIPLDAGGFLGLTARSETPIMTAPGVMPAAAGFAVSDVVSLRGEILLPGMAPLDTPLTLVMSMDIASSAFGGFGLTAFGEGKAPDGYGVRQGGIAVFDLPEGYTASSPTLHIVNNVVVPEPDRLALAGTALLVLAAMGWRLPGSRSAPALGSAHPRTSVDLESGPASGGSRSSPPARCA